MRKGFVSGKLKDRAQLIAVSFLVALFLLFAVFLQVHTKILFLNIVFTCLGILIYAYLSFYVLEGIKLKDKMLVKVGVVINTLLVGAYLYLIIYREMMFGFGYFFHGLILVVELFVFRLFMFEAVKFTNRKKRRPRKDVARGG